MESRVKLLGHPVHPMLIVFPLGLLATAAIIDVIYFVSGALLFAELSYYLIIAGLIGGVVAAPFGVSRVCCAERPARGSAASS